jgi:hypothetical protein
MKRLVLIIVAIAALAGCQKENPLFATKWVSKEDTGSHIIYTELHFITDASGELSLYDYNGGDMDYNGSLAFTYSYDKPNVIITYQGNSITGVLSDDKITFANMGTEGDQVFNKM